MCILIVKKCNRFNIHGVTVIIIVLCASLLLRQKTVLEF